MAGCGREALRSRAGRFRADSDPQGRGRRKFLTCDGWKEAIAVHRKELAATESGDDGDNDVNGSVSKVVESCLSLYAGGRWPARKCEVQLCLTYAKQNQQTNYTPDSMEIHDETETNMREARFWSYLFGTSEARERACELWEEILKKMNIWDPKTALIRLQEYFTILARCKRSEKRAAQAIALLEQIKLLGNWKTTDAFIFACGACDDNEDVVQRYLQVLVKIELKKINRLKKNKTKKGRGKKKKNRVVGGGGAADNDDERVIRVDIVRNKDVDNRTALNCACQHGYLKVARFLVEEGGMEVVVGSIQVMTSLHLACFHGHLEVACFLVAAEGGLELLTVKTRSGETAIDMAAEQGHADIVAMLKDKLRHVLCDEVAKLFG